MKRIHRTIILRVVPAVIILAALFIAYKASSVITSYTPTFLTKQVISEADTVLSFKLGTVSTTGIEGIINANGGLATADDSVIKSKSLTLEVKRYAGIDEMEKSFIKGDINLMAMTPAQFGSSYQTIQKESPAAFMLSGDAPSDYVFISRKPASSTADLKNISIACVRDSAAYLFAFTLAKLGGVPAKGIQWKFTSGDQESIDLYNKGACDAAAFDRSRIGSPETLPASAVTSASMPHLFNTIIVAREGSIASHHDEFTKLLFAVLEARNILASKSADMAHEEFARLSIDNPRYAKAHSANMIAGYDSNMLFFRLTAQRGWDFFNEFDITKELGKGTPPVAEEAAHTLILAELTPPRSVKVQTPADEQYTGAAFTLFKKDLMFDDNGPLKDDSRAALSTTALYSSIAPAARIVIVTGNAANSYIGSLREQSVRDILVKEFQVPLQRIVFAKGENPSIELSLIPPAK